MEKINQWIKARLLLVVCILFAAIVLVFWSAHQEVHDLRIDAARRLKNNDVSNAETKLLLKTDEVNLKELSAKINVLESKQLQAQSQQLALEQLYKDLSKTRDDWALSEIEQVLSTANEQLQLSGNVAGALIALENAGARLARSDKTQFAAIRNVIAKDIDQLKSLPKVDITHIALRIDAAIGQVDTVSLLADATPIAPQSLVKQDTTLVQSEKQKMLASSKQVGVEKWIMMARDVSQKIWVDMKDELRQLVRVYEVKSSEALLVSPTQAYFIRENLKLRLLNARLALLSRNEMSFKNDIAFAYEAVNKYVDLRSREGRALEEVLKEVQDSRLMTVMPNLANSLQAVHNYKNR